MIDDLNLTEGDLSRSPSRALVLTFLVGRVPLPKLDYRKERVPLF